MKQYHPEAHIRNREGNITGVLLKQWNDKNAQLIYVTWEVFIQEVQLGHVQLFEYNSSTGLELWLDKEEQKMYKKYVDKMDKNIFFESNAIFSEQSFNIVLQRPECRAIGMAATKVMLGVPMVTFKVLSNSGLSKEEKVFAKRKFGITFNQAAKNLHMAMIPRVKFVEYITWMKEDGLLADVILWPHSNIRSNIIYNKGYLPGKFDELGVNRTDFIISQLVNHQ